MKFKDHDTLNSCDASAANAARIVACVNAMAGIENPEKFRETWEAIKHLELDAYQQLKEKFDSLIFQVSKVRELQKKYFATRNTGVLAESKMAERNLDEMIKAFENPEKVGSHE